jgi:hypothetical protein
VRNPLSSIREMLDKPGDEKAQRSVYDPGGIPFKLFGDGEHRTRLSRRADAQAEYSITEVS